MEDDIDQCFSRMMAALRFFRNRCLCKFLKLLLLLTVISIIVSYLSSGPRLGLSYESLFNITSTPAQACLHPRLDPFSSTMMATYKRLPPVNCSGGQDWVIVSPDGSKMAVAPQAEKVYGPVTCEWQDVVRESDWVVKLGEKVEGDKYVVDKSDFVFVKCRGKGGVVWDSVMAGIRKGVRENLEKSRKSSKSSNPELNVMILGIDSLSRQTVARTLPKTLSWLDDHGAVTLENYNVMGDGTVAALAPLLTGLKEWELPETRRRIAKAEPVDVLPFIWKEFKERGYVTSFTEDCPTLGTFTYRLTGFTKPPTDHFMRPFFMASDEFPSQTWTSAKNACFRGTPRHMFHYNHVRQLYKKYPKKRKFSMDWMSLLSHDDVNLIQLVDEDMVQLVSEMETKGILNQTLLIVMSDHGHRFTAVRNTMQGKLEERMPFMSLRFPKWFKTSYPQAAKNLEINKGRLTTALDVHATFKHLLLLTNNQVIPKVKGIHPKAISLLEEIPLSRDCSSAGIETHWCGCLNWASVGVASDIALEAANHLLAHVNAQTDNYRHLCRTFSLGKIVKASIMAPKKEVLQFKKSVGPDAEEVDMGESSRLMEIWVQVQVILQPGQAKFDATLKYSVVNKQFTIEGHSSVSRISMYRGQAECVDEEIRPFCYCLKISYHN